MTVASGSAVEIAVGVSGSAPLQFQWFKDGAPVANQTNASLVLPEVLPADAGRYRVVVSNEVGAVTSAEVQLTVLLAAGIALDPASDSIVLRLPSAPGMSFTLEAADSLTQAAWTPQIKGIADGEVVVVKRQIGTNSAGFFRFKVNESAGANPVLGVAR
jgi:hypothetical protein